MPRKPPLPPKRIPQHRSVSVIRPARGL
jgi:hypothetical protein